MNINISQDRQNLNKFLNVKIGRAFFELLNTHQLFQNNWKLVSPCFYFLQRISDLCYHAEEPITFYNKEIKEIFRPYTDNSEYRKYVDALIELHLLEVNEHYQQQLEYQNRVIQQGECKKYWVTELGLKLLTDSDVEYLKKLHYDKECRRRNQKNVSYRLNNQEPATDPIIQHTADILNNATYNFVDGEHIISGSNSLGRTKNITRSLLDITTKDYMKPKYNQDSDGRLVNSYTMLANDVKDILSVNGHVRRVVVDIRACHPTFWSSYILTNWLYSNSYIQSLDPCLLYNIIKSPPSSLHYEGDISDNSVLKSQKWDELRREHNKWISLFLDEIYDPRNVIGDKIGRTKEFVKEALNATLNGSNQYSDIKRYLQSEFPALFAIWQITNVKQTGVNIGRQYESVLMLDKRLYELASEMGLKIGYENDGLSVFAKPENTDVMDQTRLLINYIRVKSKELFGFAVIMKVELK